MSSSNHDEDNGPDFSFLQGDPAFNADSDFDGDNRPAEPVSQTPASPDPTLPPSAMDSPDPAPQKSSLAKAKRIKKQAATRPSPSSVEAKEPVDDTDAESTISQSKFNVLVGYAAALTLLLLALLLTGRVSLSGGHQLESLPDIRPLKSDEFQLVPASAALPTGHTLQLGESRRFGDVILTPEKVTFEPVKFVHMSTKQEAADLQTPNVLKLWFTVENAAADISFSAWDVDLMCHHSQRSSAIATDENTLTNSWLLVTDQKSQQQTQLPNLLHSPASSFDIADFGGSTLVAPQETLMCFVASSQSIGELKPTAESYRWRIQIRKGVNRQSGAGVTTLVDVDFDAEQIQEAEGA